MLNKILKCGALVLLSVNCVTVFIHALFNSNQKITTLMQNIGFSGEVLGVSEYALGFTCSVVLFGAVCPIILSLVYRKSPKMLLFMTYPIVVAADFIIIYNIDPFGKGGDPMLFPVAGYMLFMAVFCLRQLKTECV